MKKIYFALTLASAVLVQAQGPRGGPGGGRDFMHFMGAEGGRPGHVVTGAPFSGQEVTTETRTLANGTHITNTITTQYYRDALGRTRTERTLTGLGPLGAAAAPKTTISIFDPVGGVSYMLNPDRQTATKMTMHAPPERPAGATTPRTAPAGVTVVELGTQTIAGVAATGTRRTRVIPAGEVGNDQPITIVDERWYSSELQVNVLTKHSDPRMGEVDFTFQNLQRTTPDASLFAPPASYSVTTSSFRHGGPGGGPAGPPPAEN